MTKVYKNVNAFLMENFPKAYLDMKNDEETSLQHYIDSSSEQFNKTINEIIRGNRQVSHINKSTQASMT
jgi:hypothetical protein